MENAQSCLEKSIKFESNPDTVGNVGVSLHEFRDPEVPKPQDAIKKQYPSSPREDMDYLTHLISAHVRAIAGDISGVSILSLDNP